MRDRLRALQVHNKTFIRIVHYFYLPGKFPSYAAYEPAHCMLVFYKYRVWSSRLRFSSQAAKQNDEFSSDYDDHTVDVTAEFMPNFFEEV